MSVLTVQDIAELPGLEPGRRGGRGRASQRGQLAARLRARRPDAVPRRRRVPAHDRPRGRRDGDDPARLHAPPGRARPRGSRLRRRLRLCRRSRPRRRGGQQALFPRARRPVRDSVRRHHEGGLHAPRERAARAGRRGRSRCTSAWPTRCSRGGACRRSSRSSATTSTAASRSSTRAGASSPSATRAPARLRERARASRGRARGDGRR